MGQDCPSVLLYMMHSNNNNNNNNIYMYIYIRAEAARLRRASTAMAPRKKQRNTHDGIPMMVLPQLHCANRARKPVYFLRKTKMADGRFLVFRRALLG